MLCIIISDLHEEFEKINTVLDAIKGIKPDFLFICGDIFKTPTPDNMKRNYFFYFVSEASKYTHIVGVAGNHDIGTTGTPLDPINILNKEIRIFTKPSRITLDNVNIVCVPWLQNPDNAEDIITFLVDRTKTNFLITHAFVLGARENRELIVTNKYTLPPGVEKLFQFCFCGHIHRFQIIDNICIPGSIDRIDFGERNDEDKGFVIYDNGRVELISLNPKKMFYFGELTQKDAQERIASYPSGSIVRGTIIASHDEIINIKRDDIVLKYKVIRPTRQRNIAIENDNSIYTVVRNVVEFTGKKELGELAKELYQRR